MSDLIAKLIGLISVGIEALRSRGDKQRGIREADELQRQIQKEIEAAEEYLKRN